MSTSQKLTRRRLIGSGAVVTLGAIALAACSGGAPAAPTQASAPAPTAAAATTGGAAAAPTSAGASAAPTTAASTPAAAAAPSGKTPVTVAWQYWPVGGQVGVKVVNDNVLKPWNDKHPELQVKDVPIPGNDIKTKLLAQVAAKTAPDVSAIDNYWYQPFAARNAFLQLDDLIKGEKFDLTQFFDAALQETDFQGKRYSLPYIGSTRIYYYNLDLFQAAGVTTPDKLWQDGQWTWDKMVEIGKQLTKRDNSGRASQFGLLVDADVDLDPHYIWGAGGDILNPAKTESVLNQPGAVNALKFQQDLIWTHQISPKQSDMQDIDLFATGKLAMIPSWRGTSIVYRTYNFKWDIVQPPVGKAGKVGYYKGNSMCIMSSTQQPQGAWEWTKYVTGPVAGKGYVSAGGATPLKANLPDLEASKPPDHASWYMTPLQEGWAKLLPFNPHWAEIENEAGKAYQAMFFQQADVQKTTDALVAKIKDILAQPVT